MDGWMENTEDNPNYYFRLIYKIVYLTYCASVYNSFFLNNCVSHKQRSPPSFNSLAMW